MTRSGAMDDQDVGILERALRLARSIKAEAEAAGQILLAEAEGNAIARMEERLLLLQNRNRTVATTIARQDEP
jgi:hypothetical protein